MLFNGSYYDTTGVYVDTLQAGAGCDSIVTLELTVLPIYMEAVPAEICDGDDFDFNGTLYTEAGTYVDTLTAVNDRDLD